METITHLVNLANRNDDSAKEAALRLVEIGASVVPAIVDGMHTVSKSTLNLRKVILQIRDPGIVPLLIGLLEDDHSYVRSTAFEALGRSKIEQAFQPLLDQLMNLENLKAIEFGRLMHWVI